MTLVAGRILLPHDAVDGWMELRDGCIVAWGDGEAPDTPDQTGGWLVPAPVNGHTHIADTFLRDREKPTDVAALVGPGGWKHQQLARATPAEQADGALRLAREMAAEKTRSFLDFREGGAPGVAWLKALAPRMATHPIVFGRPQDASRVEEELAALHAAGTDGIGLSGLRDLPGDLLDDWADAARRAGLPLAVHVSEDRRDDIEQALSLDPAFVVHMVQGTAGDFEALADADVPVVACPRSNAFFGMTPPLAAMQDADVMLALGTDNGMLCDGSLRAEARAAAQAGLDSEDALRAMGHGGHHLMPGLTGEVPASPRRGQAWVHVPGRGASSRGSS